MPLVLVATPGAADANAYATVEAAVAVAAYRIGGAAFIALTPDQQIQALVTGAMDIDSLEGAIGFLGDRATDEQALEWPRTGTDFADDELPASLVSANIELALWYTSLGAFAPGATIDVLNQARVDANLKRKKVDVLEKEWFAPKDIDPTTLERFPDPVWRLLLSLLRTAVTSGGWGTGVVVRGS